MHDQAPEALFVKEAMDRVTDDLAEPIGLTARAVRDGRRRRLRSRLAIGGAAACTAALAVTGLAAVLPGTGNGTGPVGAQVGGAPPRVFPTATLTPTVAPTAPPTPQSEAERLRIEAYRQATAGVLQDLLPPEIGQIRLVSDDVSGYLATSSHGEHFIRFSVAPAQAGSGQRLCLPAGLETKGTCLVMELSDGTPVTLRVMPEGDGTVTATSATFHFGNSDVSIFINPDDRASSSAPVTDKQLAHFVAEPRVLDLIRQADQHPVQAPQISHNEGENQ
ncbi:hypothetical protein ACIHEI_08490 [Kitasatospora sp. NPDC051984]|uniref:hypothetical protein n=1 Tax=Kitasatospora sp. NPDC051984 TaxID=3364059 RepID=UPI0037C7AD99